MNVAILQQTFVANVRRHLKSSGWTLTELARRMGVAQPMVSQYMNGHRSPGFDVVERFAAALECDPHELLRVTEMENSKVVA